jgi:hypothetical protein
MHEKAIADQNVATFKRSGRTIATYAPDCPDARPLHRSFDEILDDVAGVVGQITELLGRPTARGFRRSIAFRSTLRRIQHNSAHLRDRIGVPRD